MATEIPCPRCDRLLKIPTHVMGMMVRCRSCAHEFAATPPASRAAGADDGPADFVPVQLVEPQPSSSPDRSEALQTHAERRPGREAPLTVRPLTSGRRGPRDDIDRDEPRHPGRPWFLFVLALLPLGVPLIGILLRLLWYDGLGAILWGGIGAVLVVLCLLLALPAQWSIGGRVAGSLGLGMMGYALLLIGAVVGLLLPSAKPTTRPEEIIVEEKKIEKIAEGDWKEFAVPAGRCKVLMPGVPQRQQHDINGAPYSMFIVERKPEDGAFLVGFFDLPPHEIGRIPLEQRFESARQRMLMDTPGAKLLNEQPIQLEEFPGRELVISSPGNIGTVARMYLVETRFYMVLAAGRGYSPETADVKKFLDSFRVEERELPPNEVPRPDVATLHTPKDRVVAVAFAPDSQTVATAGSEGVLRLWNATDGREKSSVRRESGDLITRVRFSADGKKVATVQGGTVYLHNTLDLDKSTQLPGSEVAFDPTGRTIATVDGGTVRLWNAATNQEQGKIEGLKAAVRALAFSPDGKTLAAGGEDHLVKLWDVATRQERMVLKGHTGGIRSLEFSADGMTLASASLDGTAKLWDPATGKEKVSLEGHTGAVRAAVFASQGKFAITGGADGTVAVWDCATGKELALLKADHMAGAPVADLAVSPDGQRMAVPVPGLVKLWDPSKARKHRVDVGGPDGKPVHECVTLVPHHFEIKSLTFAPDGRTLLTASDTVRVWDPFSGEELTRLAAGSPILFTPDGKKLATLSSGGAIQLRNAATFKAEPLVFTAKGQGGWTAYGFSPDGKMAVGMQGATFRSFEMDTGKEVVAWKNLDTNVMNLTFSPDSQTVALAAYDKPHVKLCDPRTGVDRAVLAGHSASVLAVAYRLDGKQLASASRDGTVCLWDPATNQRVARIATGSEIATGVAFSPDGAIVAGASSDGWVRLWDTQTRKPLAQVRVAGHPPAHNHVAFSRDGRWLAAGMDRWARVWDVARLLKRPPDRSPIPPAPVYSLPSSGPTLVPKRLAGFSTIQGGVHAMAFTPDGKTMAVGTDRDSFYFYDLPARQRAALPGQGNFWKVAAAIAPDGKTMAVGKSRDAVELWDVATNQVRAKLPVQRVNLFLYELHFSPDGKTLLAVHDGFWKMWDMETQKERLTRNSHAHCAAFSRDSKLLALGCSDHSVQLWDMEKDQTVAEWKGHQNQVKTVAITPDGKTVISGGTDQTIRFWDVATRKERDTWEGPDGLFHMALSPDGKLLAAASRDNKVRLFDVATREVRAVVPYENSLLKIVFSPDGKTLATGHDGSVWLWDLSGLEARRAEK